MTGTELEKIIKEYTLSIVDKETVADTAKAFFQNSDAYQKECESNFEKLYHECIKCKQVSEDFFVLSLFANICKRESVYEDIYKRIIRSTELSKENKYFILWQLGRIVFLEVSLQTEKLRNLNDDLYDDIYQRYIKAIDNLSFIPRKQRNEKLIIVFVGQMLNINHAPTKVLLDRCYTIQKEMGKRILIINTAEVLSPNGLVEEWFQPHFGTYNDEYSKIDSIRYKDEAFAMFQCPRIRNDIDIISMLVAVIQKEKPWCAISVGDESIMSDICSALIPVLTLPTVFSFIACTRSQFQMKTGDLTDEDIKWMYKHHYNEEHFVNEIFTFTFKEQTHHYSRKELLLPNNGKIAVVCGGRLNDEIDAEFMRCAKRLAEHDIYIAFAGGFDKLNDYTENDELLKKYTINLGYQTDMLAVYECCDFYLNPQRQGGGCSAAEALFKGLPAFTLNYGDVGVSAGKDFHVTDYDHMVSRVIEAAENPDIYEHLSEKARERGALLTDTARPFMDAMMTIEKREAFG